VAPGNAAFLNLPIETPETLVSRTDRSDDWFDPKEVVATQAAAFVQRGNDDCRPTIAITFHTSGHRDFKHLCFMSCLRHGADFSGLAALAADHALRGARRGDSSWKS
jgi:hypothetical protein